LKKFDGKTVKMRRKILKSYDLKSIFCCDRIFLNIFSGYALFRMITLMSFKSEAKNLIRLS